MAERYDLGGATVHRGFLDPAAQAEMVEALRGVAAAAPLVRSETRWGRKLSVAMTAAGAIGWVSDRRGYRYQDRHPAGGPWPPMPPSLVAVWRAVVPGAAAPDTALVNYYGEGARMGMHQDRDEADLSHPVVSISLGDEALFRVGGATRGGKTVSAWLASGDVVVLSGPARLAYHGVDRIRFGSSTLLPHGGRLNVTLRRAR